MNAAPPQTAADRIESAVAEIERLAASDVGEEEFFRTFLCHVQTAIPADAAAVWLLSQSGLVNRICETGFDELQLDQNRPASRLNIQYMLDAIQSGESKIHEAGEAGSPIDHPLLTVTLRRNDDNVGVVELFLPRGTSPAQRQDRLQLLEEMCGCAGRYLAWRQESDSPENQLEFWARFEQFQSVLHGSLDSARIALTAVNDARQLLGCDRVSIALRRGTAATIAAVSGQERVAQRANAVRELAAVAGEVIAAGQPVTFSGSLSDVPPQLERLLEHYSSQSKVRMVMLIPLLERPADAAGWPGLETLPSPGRSAGESFVPSSLGHSERTPAFGALIVEQFADDWLTPLAAQRAEQAAGHLASALHNARAYEEVFFVPTRRALGRCVGRLMSRRFALAGAVLVAVALSIAALCVIPATYRVTGEGRLMPAVQHDLFAPADAEVVAVHVAGGETVRQGQVLVELRNEDLAAQHVAVRNQLETKSQQLTAMQATLDSALRTASQKELIELQGRVAQTRIEISGLRQRADILHAQIEKLTVRAPIDGTVATFQADQLLKHRPVRRGEVLLEVMDKSGPWRLELEVPEHRLDHLTRGRPPEAVPALPVEFVLATRPEARYRGAVQKVGGRTDLSADAGSVVRVLIEIDRDEIPHRRIGAEVQAKIACRQSNLAYVLFGDAVEFVQKRVW